MPVSRRQKTISKEASFSGKALQTGKEVEVVCRPSPSGTGISFLRKDSPNASVVVIGRSLPSGGYAHRSTIGPEGAEVQTVEHFLAALWALGIDNMLVEINGPELPAMDGSAREFVRILRGAGITEQPEEGRFIRVKEPVSIEEGSASLTVMPLDGFSVSYFIDYECPAIAKEEFRIDLDGESFVREIAPARTFCLEKEAKALLMSGLGKGATFENTLVMGAEGPIGTSLRFPNEPVRHKVLDLVGDLYLLGIPVLAKVIAKRSGHRLNTRMVKEIHRRWGESAS